MCTIKLYPRRVDEMKLYDNSQVHLFNVDFTAKHELLRIELEI